jgi:DNA-directed RNA polymerase subunit beta'
VVELFEARDPKGKAPISHAEGRVSIELNEKELIITVIPDDGSEEQKHKLPKSIKTLTVKDGDAVIVGQPLTAGVIDPKDKLRIQGPREAQMFLVNEVQEVYRLQGVEINDKHIEIIVRQMLRKVKITEPGDTQYLWGEQIDRMAFEDANREIEQKGGKPAEATPVLLGITKASLETESFISAASFQDTTRILTDAATLGKVDKLLGFKENVIMGHLIPAGTGFSAYRKIKLLHLGEPVGEALISTQPEEERARKVALDIPAALAS